jgi:putative RNA ligase
MDEIASIEDIQKLAVAGFADWKQYGNVTVKRFGDLLIFNYNTMAQYEGRWNFFEQVSRGLILNHKTGEIVARPFDKFYNWLEGGRRAKGHIVAITEKIDGSLAVLFRTPEGYRIATRGDMTSRQSEWATDYLNTHFDLTGLPEELTLLFEIIYPGNRVVIDYGQREDLVLLAARNRFTGAYLPFFPDVYELAQTYGFSLPRVFTFNDITQIIEQTGKIGPEEEGYVVEFSDGSRFKFKGDRYKEMQRLIMSLTFKNTLRAMESGTIEQTLEMVPDEFLGEVRGWMAEIRATLAAKKAELEAVFATAPKGTRKEFAQWVMAHHKRIAPYLFALFDGEPLEPLIYEHHDWGHREEKREM